LLRPPQPANSPAGLDTTIAADVQGPIVETFGELDKLAWVGVGFPLGSISVILLFGIAYGLFEVKWLALSSIALFEIGSAVCGAAPTMNAIIAGRVIAGAGGGGGGGGGPPMYLG
jgi:MFS family permease